MRKQTVLPDTSLCAIVRDEKMNPAGGIGGFIRAHVPFVEQAVIADTGSVDGTREILEEMQARYPNLKVVDIPFEGYAEARNKAMGHVTTKRVLVLDADELLTHKTPQNDWEIVKKYLEEHPSPVYRFDFLAIPPSGANYSQFDVHSRRLFDKNFVEFSGSIWETAVYDVNTTSKRIEGVCIKHFVPSDDGRNRKKLNWYFQGTYLKIPPSQAKEFSTWKTFNPLRNNYV